MGVMSPITAGRVALGAIGLLCASAAGPVAADDLSKLSLEELLQTPVEVVTRSDRPQRETPGIVSVITRDELARSGARDLIDVLRGVPGFGVALDVQGVLAVGFRGATSAGGQILLLVDGQEQNESLYGTPLLHYPVDLIEKIEIIRGPGSVIYGGFAELAVINIITRGAEHGHEVVVGARYGQMDHGLGYRDVHVAGRDVVAGTAVSVAVFAGQGYRTDAIYTDLFGNAYRLTNRIDPTVINVGAAYRGVELRLIGDWLRTTSRDAISVSEPAPVATDFRGGFAELGYQWKLGDRITLTPRLQYKRQQPWRVEDTDAVTYYRKTAERYLGALTLDWQLTDALGVLVGAEAFTNRARLDEVANLGVGFQEPLAGGDRDEFSTITGYGQLLVDHRWADLSLGLRVERNDRFGTVVVPRIGVTRRLGRAHAKLLVSQAFRAPGHEPYSLNLDLQPEKATTYEVEAGYQFGDHLFASGNLFDLTIRQPFVYAFNRELGMEHYVNFDRTGSRGAEVVLRAQYPRARVQLTWSIYDASGKNQVPLYAIPGHDDLTAGFAANKVTMAASLDVAHHLSLDPAATWIGTVYGPVAVDGADEVTFGAEPSRLLLDLFVLRRDLAVPGLDVGLGVHDLLDQGLRFVERSAIAHAPLPGPTREYSLRVTYRHELGAPP